MADDNPRDLGSAWFGIHEDCLEIMWESKAASGVGAGPMVTADHRLGPAQSPRSPNPSDLRARRSLWASSGRTERVSTPPPP